MHSRKDFPWLTGTHRRSPDSSVSHDSADSQPCITVRRDGRLRHWPVRWCDQPIVAGLSRRRVEAADRNREKSR